MASFKRTTLCCQPFWFCSSPWWEKPACFVGRVNFLKVYSGKNLSFFMSFTLQITVKSRQGGEHLCVFTLLFLSPCELDFCCVLPPHGPSSLLPGCGCRAAQCMLRALSRPRAPSTWGRVTVLTLRAGDHCPPPLRVTAVLGVAAACELIRPLAYLTCQLGHVVHKSWWGRPTHHRTPTHCS